MSSDLENEYFCDGITEEIINALAKIGSLKVTSRTSSFYFKDKEIPLPEIATSLGVTTILEGSARLAGDTVRITAQLIQAKEDFHFWSEKWDRKLEHIFEVQDEISLLIADKIRENFGHFEMQTQLVENQTENVEVYACYLKAQFHKNKWNPEDIKQAEALFQKSLALDPRYVPAMVGLADVYSYMGMTSLLPFQTAWKQCNDLIDKALELDPDNPEAFYQKGHSSLFTECDYAQALKHTARAIRLNPNYVEAQQLMSFLQVLSGNDQLAKKHLDIALGVDPFSQETLFYKAYFDYMTQNYEDAFEQLKHCLEVNPKNIPAHAVMTLCLLKMERYDEVLDYFDDLPVELPRGEKTGALGLAYALKNDLTKKEQYLKLLQKEANSPDGFASDSFLFMMHAVGGDFDEAFAWVESSIANKASLLLLRYPDPMVDALRADPRYHHFHQKLFGTIVPENYKASKKALLDDVAAETYRATLMEYIRLHKPFLDPELSLRSLAAQIEIHPNQLSWLLNAVIGKNFNAFVNAYRVAHFKKLARDPSNAKLTLIGLAYECGFNSKTVFNTSFKRETGLTPKQFLKG